MSHICHFKDLFQIFLYGCYIALIVPCHQKIIYSSTYTTRYTTDLSTFFINNVASSRSKCSKFNFKRCSDNFSYHAWGACLRPYKDLTSLHTFFFSFHNKAFWMRHEDILFQVSIQESSLYTHLMNFPPIMCSQRK